MRPVSLLPRRLCAWFPSAVVACVTLATSLPAWAVVDIQGDVKPAPPQGFGVPLVGMGLDDDGDGFVDWLEPGGNNVITNGIDPNNPQGGIGLPWNSSQVWVDYDTTQNILVGETGSGTLTINQGSALRYQHLVLGGLSEGAPGVLGATSTLELTTTADPMRFNVVTDAATSVPSEGFGRVVVSGPGSIFNNDPALISAGFQAALSLGQGMAATETVLNLGDAIQVTNGVPVTTREDDIGYDVIVGFTGDGLLEVNAGGTVEIQDALMAAVTAGTIGDVVVSGAGSYLVANGRSRVLNNGSSLNTQFQTLSFIGGRGSGSMLVEDRARADFKAGLSIGTSTALLAQATLADAGDGTGTVTVTGAGSTLTARAGAFDTGTFGLGVGSLRTALNAVFDPSSPLDGNLQSGTLIIADSGRVVTPEAAAAIGKRGFVEMRGGELLVGTALEVDGAIDGYGLIQAQTLETSIFSRINDPADPSLTAPIPNGPLRVVLNGGGPAVAGFDATLTNRGGIGGVIDFDVSGDVQNGQETVAGQALIGARLVAGGSLQARSLRNATGAILGGSEEGATLRLRLNRALSDELDDRDSLAMENLGTITGTIDLVTPGGVINGADNTLAEGSNGGAIRASGVMHVGAFLNHRLGQISVGAGESLSIVATGNIDAEAIQYTNLIIEDGIDAGAADGQLDTGTQAAFFTANLGSITVDGGAFEVGSLVSQVGEIVGAIDHSRLFRNARFVEVDPTSTTANNIGDESVGTITANDAQLVFREGIYNTGVVAFTAGSNVVHGVVENGGFFRPAGPADPMDPSSPQLPARTGLDYDTSDEQEFLRPGVILVSGNNTNVTFHDDVLNAGLLTVGPGGNTVNFLGDFTNTGIVEIFNSGFVSDALSSVVTVSGDVNIVGGLLSVNTTLQGGTDPFAAFATAPAGVARATANLEAGASLTLIEATGELSEDSLFTDLALPELGTGFYWDVVYDLGMDEVRLEVVQSAAIGADFSGDGIVDDIDLAIWSRNAGINSGASIVMGDADLDGDVDLSDYSLLMEQILTGTPVGVSPSGVALSQSQVIPEPTTLAAMLLAMVAAGRRRQR